MVSMGSDLDNFVNRFQEANRRFSLTYVPPIKQFRLSFTSDSRSGNVSQGNSTNLYFDAQGRLVKP